MNSPPTKSDYMPEIRHWRLVPSLLLSTVAHIFVIFFLPISPIIPYAPLPTPTLKVRLVPAIQPQENTLGPLSNDAPRPETKSIKPFIKSQPISPKHKQTLHIEAPKNMAPASVSLQHPAATESSAPPLISTRSFLDSVKNIVRDEARRIPPSKEEEPSIGDRPVLPELAKALKKQKVGETRFADGLIKIVTPSGRALCWRPLPEIVAHDGPVKPTIVPTNCP